MGVTAHLHFYEKKVFGMIIAILLVLSSGFVHALWNLFAKKSVNKVVFLWWTQWIAILVFMPWVLRDLSTMDFAQINFGLILLSMLLHGVYFLLLAKTYTLGDLSQVYPIMRGTSPILVPLLGVLILQEKLSWAGWVGVVAIIVGILSLSDIGRMRSKGPDSVSYRASGLALLVGVCIASYIVIDKIALAQTTPMVLNFSTNIGNLIALSWAALRSDAIKSEWQLNWKTILLGGVLTSGGYLLFLAALTMAPVSFLAPMREIGTVFGTLLGIFLLQEKQGTRRIAASALITSGVIVLGIWGDY